MATIRIAFINFLVATAFEKKVSMFDRAVVLFGESVTVTCDASRGDEPLPPEVERITDLYMAIQLKRLNNYENYTFALYSYGDTGTPLTNQVPGTSWKIEMTGDVNNLNDDPRRNRETMKIVLRIEKVTCLENTIFSCCILHYYLTGMTSVSEALRVYKQGEEEALHAQLSLDLKRGNEQTISYNRKGDNITLTCTVRNEHQIVKLVWRYGHVKSQQRLNLSYPFGKDITENKPGTREPDTCAVFRHESKLNFKFHNIHDGFMFLCVARERGLDTLSLNFTLFTTKEKSTSAAAITYITESTTVFSACPKLDLQRQPFIFSFVVILCCKKNIILKSDLI